MSSKLGVARALCVVVAVFTFASVAPVFGQTQGMERRDNRRDNRAAGRATKQACKAGDEHTRSECRQMKRTRKYQGRHGTAPQGQAPANAPEAPAGAPADNPPQ